LDNIGAAEAYLAFSRVGLDPDSKPSYAPERSV